MAHLVVYTYCFAAGVLLNGPPDSLYYYVSGVLLYGPPGTGKTLLARACAAQTKSTFLKLAGPQLVQMFIGDGAKLVRDAFALAKEKQPAIIFIDELDAIGKKFKGN